MSEGNKPAEEAKESNSKDTLSKVDIDDLQWLQYQDTGDQRSRLAGAIFQNPFVAFGASATVVALVCGLYYMRKNNSVKQQFFMRCRVGAQGFTIASLLGGLFYESHKRDQENESKLNQAKPF